jgi:5,5'-dehydrodivanillate O-demethylase
MLSAEDNELLTRTGAGTPMGQLLRRYWWPVAGEAELAKKATKRVRLLGEDLTLYRDRSGGLGLIGARCSHRSAGLVFGIPEQDGLRCAYHGWKFNARGECVEQPFEQTMHPEGRFRETCGIAGYPVEALGGLVWAYLGPAPAPLVPRWDVLVADHVVRQIGQAVVPCNWLQCMENSADPVHTEWLHGHLSAHVLEEKGEDLAGRRAADLLSPTVRIDFEVFEYGIIKRRLRAGDTEESDDWKYGHPLVFPGMVRTGSPVGGRSSVEIRVPIDDTHTWQLKLQAFDPGPNVDVPEQAIVPMFEMPMKDASGEYLLDYIIGQDMAAWYSQGEVTDRSREHLGESDRGVILFRKLLREQLDVVRNGGDPMNTFRDSARNQCISLTAELSAEEREHLKDHLTVGAASRDYSIRQDGSTGQFSPALDEIERLMETKPV